MLFTASLTTITSHFLDFSFFWKSIKELGHTNFQSNATLMEGFEYHVILGPVFSQAICNLCLVGTPMAKGSKVKGQSVMETDGKYKQEQVYGLECYLVSALKPDQRKGTVNKCLVVRLS